MPRKLHNALTPLTVRNAKAGRHADGGGLHLLVKETGARSWVYRFMLKGKTRDIGLGAAAGVEAVTLAAARDAATILRLQVKAGVDPLVERQRQAAEALASAQAAKVAGTTFKMAAETYMAANEVRWRSEKHRRLWKASLTTYVYPIIGEIAVSDVDTSHVLSILEPLWTLKPETAGRLRGRMEAILDAAKARGYRTGENPARWRGHIAQVLPAHKHVDRGHHKALPYDDVAALMAELRKDARREAAALEFTILTAARTGEVLGAKWSEVDLSKAIWTVPAERMKARREHRVPLTPRTIEILELMQALGGTHIFPGHRGPKLSSMALLDHLNGMGRSETVHGFRSTFRDWAAERTGFAHEVCEMALAHAIGNKAEAAYRRGDLFDKRRKLMEAWAAHCARTKASDAKVTPIRAAEAA